MRTSSPLLSLTVASLLTIANASHAETAPSAADDATRMNKIKVTAGREGESTAGNTTVLGAEQLESEQAQNLEDAIRYVPGVSIVDLGRFGDNGFNIRGLESDRVAMTVDGLGFGESIETARAYEFFRSGRGGIDIDTLKGIEIVKGADSIAAGSGALGGAVMFTTKDPYDFLNARGNDTYFRVKTGYTSASDEAMTTLSFANRTGSVESMLIYTLRKGHEAQSWYDSTPVATGSPRRTPDPVDRDSDNVLGKVDFLIGESQRFGWVAERSRSTNEIDNLSRVGGTGYLERRADDGNDRDRYGVRYLWEDAGTFFDSMEWTADRQETESRGLTTILAGSGCPRNVVPCLRSENRATDQVLDRTALDFSKAFTGGAVGHSLIYGLAWQQRDVQFEAVDTRYIGTTPDTDSVTVDPDQVPETDVANYTVYLRDSLFLFGDKLTVNAGVRYDRTDYSPKLNAQFQDASGTVRDVSFALPTWQLGADFKFMPGHSVWAQVARGFRAPSVGDMFAPTSTSTATEAATGATVTLWDSVANPNLEAEKSFNTEIGYRWQAERLELGLSVYRDKYHNFIETASFIRNAGTAYRTCVGQACSVVQGNEYTMPANLGEVTVKGVEVEGRWRIDERWSARLAWAYSEGQRKNGDPLESIVPATGVLGLRYAAASQRWDVAGNITHAAAKKLEDALLTSTDDVWQELAPDYLSNEYTVLDVFGNFNVTDDIRVSAGVYNLGDEKYYLWPRVRFVGEGTTTLYGYVTGDGIGRYSEPGRNYRASLSWRF
jgi:hemoglobin/transferrin/lactoferrin receptor protein